MKIPPRAETVDGALLRALAITERMVLGRLLLYTQLRFAREAKSPNRLANPSSKRSHAR
jgi:hypothetical protein